MEGLTVSPMLVLAVIVVLYVISSIQILAEYERGVIFRLGKLLPHPKGPGVVLVFRPIDRIVRISLRTVVHDVPPQDIITRDNVSVKVNAVVFFRVIDPREGRGRSRELRLCDVAARPDDAPKRARAGGARRPARRSAIG